MVKHTDSFIKKHEALLKQREEEKAAKAKLMEEKKEKTRERLLNRKREKYAEIKSKEPDKYNEIIDNQKKYRRIYKELTIKKYEEKMSDCKKVFLKNKKWHYYVNEFGELFSHTGRKLKTIVNSKNGYVQAPSGEMLHRIIWKAFYGEIPDGYEIDHINCVRNDNRICNLRCVTHKDNCNNPKSIENYKKHNKKVDKSYLKKNFCKVPDIYI